MNVPNWVVILREVICTVSLDGFVMVMPIDARCPGLKDVEEMLESMVGNVIGASPVISSVLLLASAVPWEVKYLKSDVSLKATEAGVWPENIDCGIGYVLNSSAHIVAADTLDPFSR